MESMNRDQLVALCRLEADPAVSIYLPSVAPAAGSRQEPLRLRNLLREASAALLAYGLDGEAARELLRRAADLVEDKQFWSAPPGGVALFVAPGFFRPVRVGFALPELVRVGRRFAVRPLAPLLGRTERFYILALSLNRVRVLEAGPDAARELRVSGLPASFDAAMNYVEYYSELSAHSSTPSALGRRAAIFHGHGDSDEENQKDNLRHFFRRVVEALERGLPDLASPVVLAAVATHFPLFRGANRRLRLAEGGVEGNPDYLSNGELAAQARARIDREKRASLGRELARWQELLPSGRSIGELDEIVRAAEEGRVETLLLASGAERWGSFEPDLGRLALREEKEPGDEELLDRAAARTIGQGGEAFDVALAAMPEHRVAAAILRYPAPVP